MSLSEYSCVLDSVGVDAKRLAGGRVLIVVEDLLFASTSSPVIVNMTLTKEQVVEFAERLLAMARGT